MDLFNDLFAKVKAASSLLPSDPNFSKEVRKVEIELYRLTNLQMLNMAKGYRPAMPSLASWFAPLYLRNVEQACKLVLESCEAFINTDPVPDARKLISQGLSEARTLIEHADFSDVKKATEFFICCAIVKNALLEFAALVKPPENQLSPTEFASRNNPKLDLASVNIPKPEVAPPKPEPAPKPARKLRKKRVAKPKAPANP